MSRPCRSAGRILRLGAATLCAIAPFKPRRLVGLVYSSHDFGEARPTLECHG